MAANEEPVTAEELAKAMGEMTYEERLAAAREALAEEQRDRETFGDLAADADADAAGKAFRNLLRGGRDG